MKKFKSYKVVCLTLGLGIALSGTVLNAASLTKTLKAVYNNIAISYNGQTKFLTSEPFIVDGTTYVPLRAIGEIMGSSVNWANNTVYITSSSLPNTSAEQEIAAKNFEIASLKQQLELAKKELETFKGTGVAGSNLTTSAINATLNEIKEEYSSDYNIDWEFDLKLSSGRLELTVSYDSRYDSNDFAKLTEAKRKQLIKEICYDISILHKDTEIRGVLEDSRTDKEISTFRYTKTGSYTYEEKSTYPLADFTRSLEKYYRTINVTNVNIPIDTIDVTEKNGTLTISLNVKINTASYITQWNAIDKYDLRDYLEEIFDDAEDEYDYDKIVVLVRDTSSGIVADYENGRINVYKRAE